MLRYYFLFIISIFLFSCTSPLGQIGTKFKDRKGSYKNTDKTITVTITDTSNQNLTINVQNVKGITIADTFDINSYVTSSSLTLKSEQNSEYSYVLIFYGNTSILFSLKKGSNFPIQDIELKNSN